MFKNDNKIPYPEISMDEAIKNGGYYEQNPFHFLHRNRGCQSACAKRLRDAQKDVRLRKG